MTTHLTHISDQAAAAAVTRAGEGEALWWAPTLIEVQLRADQTAGALSVMTGTQPAEASSPLHVHHDEDETFFLLEGSATFEIGGEPIEASVGDVVFAPRGVPHRHTVGPDGLQTLIVTTPGGQERLVRAMGTPAATRTLPPPRAGEPAPGELTAIAASHGCELLDDAAAATGGGGVITRYGEGDARWWLGGLAELQLTASQTAGALSVLTVTDPPDMGAPMHVHHRDDETFVLLEGSATFEVGDQLIEARAGDVVFGPRGVPHRYTTGPIGLKVVFVMTPGGFEHLVRDMSTPAGTRTLAPADEPTPGLDELQDIARRHHCELLLGEDGV